MALKDLLTDKYGESGPIVEFVADVKANPPAGMRVPAHLTPKQVSNAIGGRHRRNGDMPPWGLTQLIVRATTAPADHRQELARIAGLWKADHGRNPPDYYGRIQVPATHPDAMQDPAVVLERLNNRRRQLDEIREHAADESDRQTRGREQEIRADIGYLQEHLAQIAALDEETVSSGAERGPDRALTQIIDRRSATFVDDLDVAASPPARALAAYLLVCADLGGHRLATLAEEIHASEHEVRRILTARQRPTYRQVVAIARRTGGEPGHAAMLLDRVTSKPPAGRQDPVRIVRTAADNPASDAFGIASRDSELRKPVFELRKTRAAESVDHADDVLAHGKHQVDQTRMLRLWVQVGWLVIACVSGMTGAQVLMRALEAEGLAITISWFYAVAGLAGLCVTALVLAFRNPSP